MRARVTWILGALGLAGFVAYLRRRGAPFPAAPDSHAEELRRTLEESRETAERPAPVEPEPELADDLATRRRGVHERGRTALDDMSAPSAD